MENTENKTYTITTLNQICNIVNDDNIELLINDFAQWLIYYNEAIKAVREKIPNDTEKLKNIEIAKCDFVWTDDGKNELTGVILTENETGKTTKVDFKNKSFYCKNETFVKNYHGEYCKKQCEECKLTIK